MKKRATNLHSLEAVWHQFATVIGNAAAYVEDDLAQAGALSDDQRHTGDSFDVVDYAFNIKDTANPSASFVKKIL